MAGVNKVILVGNVGRDPELRTTPSGQQVAKFSVATSENFTNKAGEKQEKTEWHNVVVWAKLADVCGKYVKKGSQIYVEGRLQTSSWTDQAGQKRYRTEVIGQTIQFLGRPGERSQTPAESGQGGEDIDFYGADEAGAGPGAGAAASTAPSGGAFTSDDDLPF